MDLFEIAAVGTTLAGVGVIAAGIVHAHCPNPQTLGGCGSLGWTDAEMIDTGGGTYINEGTLLLWGMAAILLLLAKKVTWALYAGLAFIALGLTIYLVQFPYG